MRALHKLAEKPDRVALLGIQSGDSDARFLAPLEWLHRPQDLLPHLSVATANCIRCETESCDLGILAVLAVVPFWRGLQKRHRLNARNVEGSAAAEVLAGDLVVDQHHVALRLGELGAVALVAAGRQAVLLFAHHPVQIVRLRAAAVRAVQGRRLGGLTFGVISSLVHQRSPFGIQVWPSGLPRYWARG